MNSPTVFCPEGMETLEHDNDGNALACAAHVRPDSVKHGYYLDLGAISLALLIVASWIFFCAAPDSPYARAK